LLNVNAIMRLEDFYERHQLCRTALEETWFSGNTTFIAFSFYEPREVPKLLYFTTCNEGVRSIRDMRCLLSRFCLLSAIYLFRDTVFALARQNIAREGKGKRTQVFHDASWSSSGSFVSSHERKILDFEIYAVKFVRTNFLFAEASAVAENKDILNMSLHGGALLHCVFNL